LLEFSVRSVSGCLVSDAVIAGLAVVREKTPYVGPVEFALDELECLLVAIVASSRMVVLVARNAHAKIVRVGDEDTSVVKEKSSG
jgi:nitroimidazol reductase NimA-like FMN-containing flavoprotein (pyridoxamine 5'-phosphate oxidase superfamily)